MIKYALISDQSHQDSGPFSPVISKRGLGIGSIVRKAAAVASVAAKHAYAAAASSSSSIDDEMVPLKCSLMSISLPWEHIAYDLLFKVRLFVSQQPYLSNLPEVGALFIMILVNFIILFFLFFFIANY